MIKTQENIIDLSALDMKMARAINERMFGKGIALAAGFDLGAARPLDSRIVAQTITERDAHVSGNRAYEGMQVYVVETKKNYQLVDGQWVETGVSTEQLEEIQNNIDSAVAEVLADAKSYTEEKLLEEHNRAIAKEAELESSISAVSGEVSKLETSLQALDGEVADNEAEIAKLNTNLTTLTDKVDDIEVDVTAVQEGVNNLNSEVATLKADSTQAKADITKLQTDVAANTTAIAGEVARATAAEAKLTSDIEKANLKIDAEKADLTSKIGEVNTKIDEAKTELSQMDVRLQSNIDDLSNALSQETQDRADAIQAVEDQVALKANSADVYSKTEVDNKVDTAKTEAVNESKAHTDAEIAKIDAAYKAADVQVLEDAKSYAEEKVQEAKTAIETGVETSINEVKASVSAVDTKVTGLDTRLTSAESDISDIKDVLSNKNSNTVVVNTEDEIAVANPNPKVGDMAYVVSTKRAYIFKGIDTAKTLAGEFAAGEMVVVADEAMARAVAQGWIVFDEITSEIDLVNYRKKSDKIVYSDLESTLANKINNKADQSYVDAEIAKKTDEAYVNAKVEEVVNPVSAKVNANETAIAEETAERQAEITRVEGLVSAVNAKVVTNTSEIEAIKQAAEALTNKVDAHIADKVSHVTAEERLSWNTRTRKVVATIGDGVANEIEVTHNLNSEDVHVTVKEATTGMIVFADINTADPNKVVVSFGQAPAQNEFKVIVIG